MYYVFLAALTTTECCQRTMPISFSPTSVQFKGEINDALPRKRHQQRHLEFCTAYLLSRGSGVRVSPGAPSHCGVRPGDMGYTTYLSMGYTFGPNGFSSGSSTRVSRSKYPK